MQHALERRHVNRVLTGKSEGNRPLVKPRPWWEGKMIEDFKQVNMILNLLFHRMQRCSWLVKQLLATHKKTLLHIVKLHPHLHLHSTYSAAKLHGGGKHNYWYPMDHSNPLSPYKMPHVISQFRCTALSTANDYAHQRPQTVTQMRAHKQK